MSQPSAQPDHNEMAAAIERRVQAEREKAQADAAIKAQREFEQTHDKRQEFRRLIDPGILRPNAHELAIESLIVAHLHRVVVAPANAESRITDTQDISREYFISPRRGKIQEVQAHEYEDQEDTSRPEGHPGVCGGGQSAS